MLETAYLLNPGKRRKAKRSRGHARRRTNKRGWFKDAKKGSIKSRKSHFKRARYTHPQLKTIKRSWKSRTAKRKKNPSRGISIYRPRRKRSMWAKRRRNPNGLAGALKFPGQVLPFSVPVPGLPGQIINGVIQGVAAGAVVFTGYLISGALVNFIVTKGDADAAVAQGNNFKGKWARPLLHGVSAGLIGTVTAMVAPKRNKVSWALLAAAGPGLRALGGVIKAVMPRPAAPGIMQDIHDISVGMADYLQVGDLYEAGMGEEDELSDYLQVGSDDNGMEDLYEAGMGEEVPEESLV